MTDVRALGNAVKKQHQMLYTKDGKELIKTVYGTVRGYPLTVLNVNIAAEIFQLLTM